MKLETFYEKAYAWILVFGPRIIGAVVIVIAGFWIISRIRTWLEKVLRNKQLDSSLKPFLISFLITTLQVLLLVTVMQVIGIQMTVFAALLGGIGVAIGLALSGTLQNFTSGILILMLKPYKVGDNIMTQNHEGTVTVIKLFHTLVVTYDNQTVIIPNSKLSNDTIINLSLQGNRRMDIELKFKFNEDLNEIRSIIEKALNEYKSVLKDPVYRIGIASIEPDGYKVAVNLWVNSHGFVDSRFAIQEKLINDLKAAGKFI